MTDVSATTLINQMQTITKNMNAEESPGIAFGQAMHDALQHVNNLSQHSDTLKTSFEKGDSSVSLADAMIASQKENLAFETVRVVRNKAVKAYEDLMNMPV